MGDTHWVHVAHFSALVEPPTPGIIDTKVNHIASAKASVRLQDSVLPQPESAPLFGLPSRYVLRRATETVEGLDGAAPPSVSAAAALLQRVIDAADLPQRNQDEDEEGGEGQEGVDESLDSELQQASLAGGLGAAVAQYLAAVGKVRERESQGWVAGVVSKGHVNQAATGACHRSPVN
jgi:hypothetical protein